MTGPAQNQARMRRREALVVIGGAGAVTARATRSTGLSHYKSHGQPDTTDAGDSIYKQAGG
jgi:hypothetical protein